MESSEDFKMHKIKIGIKIAQLREENGYSRQDFSEMVGISLNSLAAIENGNSLVKISTLLIIVNILSLSLSTFFDLIDL